MVHRADGNGNHLAFELGEPAVAQHKVIHHVDERLQQLFRFGKVDAETSAVAAEGETFALFQSIREAESVRAGLERDEVKGGDADADDEARGFGTDAGGDLAQKARTVFE